MIHLTNDAIQKQGNEYGEYEKGNKVSFSEFQKYLDSQSNGVKLSFEDSIKPEMKRIATEAIKSVCCKINPGKKEFLFEIFGLDFMIDSAFKVWLIEINTNPCLETTCIQLQRVIPQMVEHALQIAVDPIFPPPSIIWPNSRKYLLPDNIYQNNLFELIFDERLEVNQQNEYKNYQLENNLEKFSFMEQINESYAEQL